MKPDRNLLQAVLEIAIRAGHEIMAIYRDESRWDTQQKADDSPLTAADLAAHRVIEAGLLALGADVPVLSEESDDVPLAVRAAWTRFWLVDPLDGTKEFIARNNEFSVNIALVEAGEAVLGVVYGPATGIAYVAVRGQGAFRVQSVLHRSASPESRSFQNGVDSPEETWVPVRSAGLPRLGERAVRLCASRRHRDPREVAFVAAVESTIGKVAVARAGSAFKICAVADGTADAYPRLGPTMEWDTAAGQVVLEEAGGALVDEQGRPFRYNQRHTLLNGSFLALGSAPEKWLPCWTPLFTAMTSPD
ncbi:MAG: 3'(2'),5'-bisphosphate nucleotidase CysQ [Moraxellaceae bacterium]|nr:3'(2'),5'-bisphosphate nucleotidase CysQ [Moraxellaceae bacterium]